MLSPLLPPILVGAITYLALLASTIFWFGVMVPAVLLKLIPLHRLQRACSRWCVWAGGQWVSTNQILLRLIHAVQWDVDFRNTPLRDANYLLLSNHQTWADILLLFDVFHGRTPFPRFFLKHALLWMPAVGQACWAMDFPFMKRHSREAIAADPALRTEDLETTRRACAHYRSERVTVINFIEGTRFTEAKRIESGSPYRHLLRPKSGGMSFALNAMGEQFAGILDVTVAYRPTRRRSLAWSWLCGEQNCLAIHVDVVPIPVDLLDGDYEADAEFRARFQAFVNALWTRKDARLERMLEHRPMRAQRPAHS
jgi:1-acyl-sn-glycerol-3-phosphate acyltransferase